LELELKSQAEQPDNRVILSFSVCFDDMLAWRSIDDDMNYFEAKESGHGKTRLFVDPVVLGVNGCRTGRVHVATLTWSREK